MTEKKRMNPKTPLDHLFNWINNPYNGAVILPDGDDYPEVVYISLEKVNERIKELELNKYVE